MTSNRNRLASGGRIDRSVPVHFTFDGKILSGYRGDTLSSALLAANISMVARSFKYHRPRGIYAAGVEEPNALVTIGTGGRHEPNCQATITTLFDGLVANSQNCWPSLAFDFMSINNLFSAFFSAGFYYKTFMGPSHKAWMLYEHVIRRAAGMGKGSLEPDSDRYEKANDFCDVLVVGSGPTGIASALSAAEAGARVILVEQQFELGGSLLDETTDSPWEKWRVSQLERLKACPSISILRRTTAFGAYDHGTIALLEQVGDPVAKPQENQPRMRYWKIRAKKTIIASGMIERPAVFAKNDLPGIMLASAVRTYINRYAVLPGRNAVIFTNNDTAYETMRALVNAGAKVEILDARESIPEHCRNMADKVGIVPKTGCIIVKAHGRKHVTGVSYLSDQDGHDTGFLKSDLLCLSAGWTPTLHLWSQRGKKPVYDERSCCFLPDGEFDGIQCIGASGGHFVTSEAVDAALKIGAQAAMVALPETPFKATTTTTQPLPERPTDYWFDTIIALRKNNIPGSDSGKQVFVDLQHDVTESDIRLAHREGYQSVEHLKRYTTQGMAGDQGKTSNVNALSLMAEQRDKPIQEVGTTTFRPPFTPVPIGAFAGHEHGAHFEPIRLGPIHDWHCDHGAEQIEAGLWLRPWHYPHENETLDQSYKREAAHVRAKVGLVDVSSLGKILVQGPDAPEFLNRIYTNGWKALKVGRVRYGIMLRDDGIILDDGTTARLSEEEFFMTTTTANAAAVMSHMEFLLQSSWQDLKVRVTSVSDQWAGMALAGPSSRAVLAVASMKCDVNNDALPHMGFVCGTIAEAPVRIHRMSFSGELAYEVFTPAGYGQAVWEALCISGRDFDIQPYGTEALAALRIEKGHVAGPELDGRTIMSDLGLEGLASSKKTYIGRALANRTALTASDRPRLVGLETLHQKDRIKSGSILFARSSAKVGHGEGHVTSTTYSVHLGKNIALALLSNGIERIGETIVCANPIEGQEIEVMVVSPHFYDPDGEKLYG